MVTPMKRWVIHVERVTFSRSNTDWWKVSDVLLTPKCVELSEQGWELVQVDRVGNTWSDFEAVFKRSTGDVLR